MQRHFRGGELPEVSLERNYLTNNEFELLQLIRALRTPT